MISAIRQLSTGMRLQNARPPLPAPASVIATNCTLARRGERGEGGRGKHGEGEAKEEGGKGGGGNLNNLQLYGQPSPVFRRTLCLYGEEKHWCITVWKKGRGSDDCGNG